MLDDPTSGWEAVASTFAAIRSDVGIDVVKHWSGHLPPGCDIVDIGCGTGVPVSTMLAVEGFNVFGIDPSPTLLAAYRRNIPDAETACEVAEDSRFFDRRFHAAVAIGLIFLLTEDRQRAVIDHVARMLHPGGHFLFSAPRHLCRWNDSLTGRPSVSLGEGRYRQLLASAGCRFVGSYVDGGSNCYYHAVSA